MALSSPFALTQKPLRLMARRGRWFPIAVKLSNTGDPVEGQLRLKLLADGEFEFPPNESYCPVDLPTNSNKVIWLYGRMERFNISSVEVTFSGRGFRTLTERVPIQEPPEGQRLVLTVSEGDAGLFDTLTGLRGSGLSRPVAPGTPDFNASGPQGPIRPFLVGRDGVPDRWFGMEAADVVVLGDFPHAALSPPQISALRGFVTGGGSLLALGGANASRLSSSPLADLWPGRVTNSRSASAAEVAGLVRRYVETPRNGADRLGGAPVVVSRTSLKTGSVLRAGTSAAPLFSSYDLGAGRVLFLGFDPSQPPFNGWSGQSALWVDIFNATSPTGRMEGIDGENMGPTNQSGTQPGVNSTFNDAPAPSTPTGVLLNALSKAPQLRMPPVSQIAWFLSLYVFVLVPLNYSILRFIDRRELAWITIPVIVTVFSAFAYLAALSIRGNAILVRQVDIVQSTLGSTTGRNDSLLWLYSPKRTSYDISSSRNDAAVTDFANVAGGRQGAFSVLQPTDASSFKIEGANMWMWADRGFVSQSLADLQKGITLRGQKVVNGTPFDLRGVVWVQDHAVRSIGSLKSGASANIPINAVAQAQSVELLGGIAGASRVDKIFDEKTVANGIPSAALTAALGSNFGLNNDEAMLLGWVKKSAVPLSIGMGNPNSRDFSIVIIRVPASLAGALSSREAVVKRVGTEVVPNPSGVPTRAIDIYECTLPRGTSWTLNVRGIRQSNQSWASGTAQPGRMVPAVIEAWNDTANRWSVLDGEWRPDGNGSEGWDFEARIAANFARQPDRNLRVRIHRALKEAQISNLKVIRN